MSPFILLVQYCSFVNLWLKEKMARIANVMLLWLKWKCLFIQDGMNIFNIFRPNDRQKFNLRWKFCWHAAQHFLMWKITLVLYYSFALSTESFKLIYVWESRNLQLFFSSFLTFIQSVCLWMRRIKHSYHSVDSVKFTCSINCSFLQSTKKLS